ARWAAGRYSGRRCTDGSATPATRAATRRAARAAREHRNSAALRAREQRTGPRSRNLTVTALAGGVGGARFLRGLARLVQPQRLTVLGHPAHDEDFVGPP